MLKINSKKKVNKPANTLKPQFTQKKPLVQPEWNSTQSDLNQYKLSKAEQVQKKVSMISKHRYEAKELWLQRQDKLKKGIVDEETQTVMETCLLTKRPPERNTKNLSYFVKDDTYADYLNQAYEESEEKRLCMADLHQQEKSEFKPKIEKSRIETTTKQNNNQDIDEGDDFIRKVNESLKDARDFMTKMERYPSLSNPEKALKALTSVNKENNPRPSSSHVQFKPKPAAVNTSSTNLKSSLNNSQNGNKRNLSSSSGFKDNSPQLPKKTNKTNKVEETLSQPQPKYEESYEEEAPAPKEQNAEKGEDISNYFKSLNQIEDTIKFLEENIMGGGSSVPEKKENNLQEAFAYKAPSALERFGFEDLSIKSPIMNNKIQEYSPHHIEEKDEEEDSYFKQRQPSPKHHDSDHEDDDKGHHEKDLSHDDEQISFALTMRSNDQTERNYGHDQHHDHGYGKPDYASKLFGFDDMISPVATTLQKPFPIPIQSSPEYPQAIFENKAIQERTRNQNIQPTIQHSPPKAQPVEEEEEEEDEEDFNIDRIKGLLQATKLEIEKMNTNQMDAYNNSYKTALDDMDKENVSSNKGFTTLPKYNNFDDTYKSDYPMGKKIEVVKNEAFITVKQPFNALWENQRRVLADVNNTRNMFDDDIPAPQTLEIKKQAVAMNYSPKKVDDVPFNFRSFRK